MISIYLGEKLFRYRGVLPIPLLLAMIAGTSFSTTHVVTGSVLILLGETLRVWAVGHIGGSSRKTDHAIAPVLCSQGPYRLTRNPLYIANVLIYLGFAGLSNTLWPWFPMLVFVFYGITYSLIVRYEESVLQMTFASEFGSYQAVTPRWLPRKWPAGLDRKKFSLKVALVSENWTLVAILAAAGVHYIRWKFQG